MKKKGKTEKVCIYFDNLDNKKYIFIEINLDKINYYIL